MAKQEKGNLRLEERTTNFPRLLQTKGSYMKDQKRSKTVQKAETCKPTLHAEALIILDNMRNHVAQMKGADGPDKSPYNAKLNAHQQHPECRAGGMNACDTFLHFILRIELERYKHNPLKSRTSHCTLQNAPAYPNYKGAHNQVIQEAPGLSDPPQDHMGLCTLTQCTDHYLAKSQSFDTLD